MGDARSKLVSGPEVQQEILLGCEGVCEDGNPEWLSGSGSDFPQFGNPTGGISVSHRLWLETKHCGPELLIPECYREQSTLVFAEEIQAFRGSLCVGLEGKEFSRRLLPSSKASSAQPLTNKGKTVQNERGHEAQMLHKGKPHLFHRGRGPLLAVSAGRWESCSEKLRS